MLWGEGGGFGRGWGEGGELSKVIPPNNVFRRVCSVQRSSAATTCTCEATDPHDHFAEGRGGGGVAVAGGGERVDAMPHRVEDRVEAARAARVVVPHLGLDGQFGKVQDRREEHEHDQKRHEQDGHGGERSADRHHEDAHRRRVRRESEDAEHANQPQQPQHRGQLADRRQSVVAAAGGVRAVAGTGRRACCVVVRVRMEERASALERCEVELGHPPRKHREDVQPVPRVEEEAPAV
jgi:hypothetical protein